MESPFLTRQSTRERVNDSTFSGFLLLGFSNRPRLQTPLFVVILTVYFLSFLGNGTIILLSRMDTCLHTPMDFFLSNLSFMDLCLTTCTVLRRWPASRGGTRPSPMVAAFPSSSPPWGSGAWSVCSWPSGPMTATSPCARPRHYRATVRPHLCLQRVLSARLTGFGNAVLDGPDRDSPLCGRSQLDHCFCEVPVMLTLARADTSISEPELFTVSVFFLVVPLSLIFVSYGHITQAVLKIKSAQGRRKAFGTCGSHLMVVVIFSHSSPCTSSLPPVIHRM